MTLHPVIPVGYGTGRWLSGGSEPLRGDFTRLGGLPSLYRTDTDLPVLCSSTNETTRWRRRNRVQSPNHSCWRASARGLETSQGEERAQMQALSGDGGGC